MRKYVIVAAKALTVIVLAALILIISLLFINNPVAGAAQKANPSIVYTMCPGDRYGAMWEINGYAAHGTSVDWATYDAPDMPILEACGTDQILAVLNNVRGIK